VEVSRVPAKRRQFGRGYETSGWSKGRSTSSPYSFQWASVRREVMKRDRFQCQLRYPGCVGRATEADHIVSVADGGEHTLENARAVCKPCHRRRTAQQGGEASKAARERQKGER
jgi:5-methylcytosine-specific restriction endonuclease McrA